MKGACRDQSQQFAKNLRVSCTVLRSLHSAGSCVGRQYRRFLHGHFGVAGRTAGWRGGGDEVLGYGYYSSDTLYFDLGFSATITNFYDSGWCGYDCPEYFSGTIDSGTLLFGGSDRTDQHLPYAFTATILPGGTFYGVAVYDPIHLLEWNDQFTLIFASQPDENGWWSTGELSWAGSGDEGGEGGSGDLGLTTYATPEPATIWLFGSGSLAFGRLLKFRRKARL